MERDEKWALMHMDCQEEKLKCSICSNEQLCWRATGSPPLEWRQVCGAGVRFVYMHLHHHPVQTSPALLKSTPDLQNKLTRDGRSVGVVRRRVQCASGRSVLRLSPGTPWPYVHEVERGRQGVGTARRARLGASLPRHVSLHVPGRGLRVVLK